MKEKFLPIGTVCSLKGINKKIMITGFFGVSYNGMVKMYDYVGYEYPEGMLLQNRSYLFNHGNIEKIEFLGYETEEHKIMNNNLLKKNTAEEKVEANGVFSNFKFDENGVVIFDGTVESMPKAETVEEKKVTNPFNEIYQKPTETKQSDDQTIFNRFKFDANGVVIAEVQSSEVSGFKFDENGVVIADNTMESKADNDNSQFKFDENGVVIADGTQDVSALESEFKFDENGVVIADGIQSGSLSEPGFKFDENGVVIAEF